MEKINKRKVRALINRLTHDERVLILEAVYTNGYYHPCVTKREDGSIGVVDFYSCLSIKNDGIELLNSIINKVQTLNVSYIINCVSGYYNDKLLLIRPIYEDAIRELLFELKKV